MNSNRSMAALVNPLRTRLRPALRFGRDLFYNGLVFGLMRPTAHFLPPSVGHRVANGVGWLLSMLPSGRATRRDFELAFPDGPHDPGRITREWLAMKYHDYRFIRRVLVKGVDTVADTSHLVVEMPEATRRLVEESDQSVMVAMAHFRREAVAWFFGEGAFPRRTILVAAPLPEGRNKLETVRLRALFGQMLEYVEAVNAASTRSTRGSVMTVSDMIARSGEPGWAPNIHIDAPIEGTPSKSFVRPFAGHPERRFATGTARIARMAQIPIVMCFPHLDERGRVVLPYSEPIDPADPDDRDADERITSRMLDEVERLVGRWPGQYVFDIGVGRRWDPTTETWVDADDEGGQK